MLIWISSADSTVTFPRAVFTLVRDHLTGSSDEGGVSSRFHTLSMLAALPWLDQPRLLDPARLTAEIHCAWDELWTLRVNELKLRSETKDFVRRRDADADIAQTAMSDRFGRYLARPLYELAVFAARSGPQSRLCAGTHRKLVAAEGSADRWRVIQGGRCTENAWRYPS